MNTSIKQLRPFGPRSTSYPEKFLQLAYGIFRIFHRMSDCPIVCVDLVVVPALMGFVAEEMDRCIVYTADLLFCFDMPQAVGLIPSRWKNIKGDLAANGEPDYSISALFTQRNNFAGCSIRTTSACRTICTHVRPRCENRLLSSSTNFSRIWCCWS